MQQHLRWRQLRSPHAAPAECGAPPWIALRSIRATLLLAPLLFCAAALPAHAEDLGKLWPACKGWNSPDGLDLRYTPQDLSAHEAREALDHLAASERQPLVGDAIDGEIDAINRVEGYALRRRAESPSWDAPYHQAAVKKFCQWLVTHYMPE